MSPGSGFDWPVNVKAALREAGPALAKVMRERPGSESDRVQQEYHRARNLAAAKGGPASWERHRAQVDDADRFIAEMREKAGARNIARAAAWRERNGKRTA